MHHRFKTVRRAALGAALIAAALPAVASAGTNPTCTWNEFTHEVKVFERSGVLRFDILRDQNEIAVRNEGGALFKCFSLTGSGKKASVYDTDKITVTAASTSAVDYYRIDASGGALVPGLSTEADGESEIEIDFATGAVKPKLEIWGNATGRAAGDAIYVGGAGDVNLGFDNDVDVRMLAGASSVGVFSGDGHDLVSGQGNKVPSTLPRAQVSLNIDGGAGNDVLYGGAKPDLITGSFDQDYVDSVAGGIDTVDGGPGLFDHSEHELGDKLFGFESDRVIDIGL